MPSFGYTLSALAGAFIALTGAIPTHDLATLPFTKRGFSCSSLASGLTQEACEWMSTIGMAGQGTNSLASNGNIWVGDDGPNTFRFVKGSSSSDSVTVIVWDFSGTDYQASFMNIRTPKISYTLANTGDEVTISLANGISGGFTSVHSQTTVLSQYGQIYNTWGEFTTGDYATVDVSREVNMGGSDMSVTVKGSGCVSNMDTCSFHCKSGNECGESGSYSLVNCDSGSQEGASYGTYDGVNPEGGCQGFSNGGHLDISV